MSKLLYYREQLNLTQEELSHKSGVSVRTIQRIEAGTNPKGHTLKVLAEALNIEDNKLLEKDDKPADLNYSLIKLINLSSILFVCFPPINILLPLIIMFTKKQFGQLTKQIVSLQILWTIIIVAAFILGSYINSSFLIDRAYIIAFLILLVLLNIFIILRNTVEIDKNQRLYISFNFSII